ncbi:MAG: Inner membrane protein YrbG [Chlamydiae bacterium]|nr:Inner membrane protein YrbG [Chlamydiota bacterium]
MEIGFVLVTLGVGLLWVGSEVLVHYAQLLSDHFKISHSVIGLSFIALGTSMPELFTNVIARMRDASGAITLGSVLGSNTANIAFVLATATLIQPFSVPKYLKKFHLPLVLIITLLFGLTLLQTQMSRIDGVCLLAVGILALIYLLKKTPARKEEALRRSKVWLDILIICVSMAMILYGAHLFLDGALKIATFFNIPDRIISLTMIAIGTSLPEWATAIISSIRKKYTLALALVLGSNIMNLFIITGISALIRPFPIDKSFLMIDFPVMAGFTFLLYLFSKKAQFTRPVGAIFFALYIAYLAFLVG